MPTASSRTGAVQPQTMSARWPSVAPVTYSRCTSTGHTAWPSWATTLRHCRATRSFWPRTLQTSMLCTTGAWRASRVLGLEFLPGAECTCSWLHVTWCLRAKIMRCLRLRQWHTVR